MKWFNHAIRKSTAHASIFGVWRCLKKKIRLICFFNPFTELLRLNLLSTYIYIIIVHTKKYLWPKIQENQIFWYNTIWSDKSSLALCKTIKEETTDMQIVAPLHWFNAAQIQTNQDNIVSLRVGEAKDSLQLKDGKHIPKTDKRLRSVCF